MFMRIRQTFRHLTTFPWFSLGELLDFQIQVPNFRIDVVLRQKPKDLMLSENIFLNNRVSDLTMYELREWIEFEMKNLIVIQEFQEVIVNIYDLFIL